jgi:hypothetical protein
VKAFLAILAIAVVLCLCCGWFAQGIDPPPINTPTPTGATP